MRHLAAGGQAHGQGRRHGIANGLMTDWTMHDFEYWDDRVREVVGGRFTPMPCGRRARLHCFRR
jgi:hypothetical protein